MKRLNLFFGAAALFVVSLAMSPSVLAQERGPYETNRFGDNWFIGVAGGVNLFWYEGMDNANFKIGPSVDANFGKWFTPAVGARVGYQGINFQVKGMEPEKLGYMYIHGDFLWNMSDALGGYKEARFWNFVPYLHAGYFRSYGLSDFDFADNEIAAGAGLQHNLRLARRLDLIIDMRATVVNGRVIGDDGVAILPSVTMGLAVDLGWPSFVRTSTVIAELESVMVDQIAALEAAALALEVANESLQQENATLNTANDKLKKQVKQLQKPTYTVEDFFTEMGPATVYFNIGATVLDEKEMQHMDFIAKNLIEKADKETKIYITLSGTADSTTGTMKRNDYLSKARGEYIYNLLTEKYGIDGNRLNVQSKVIANPAKPALSRAVTISF